jgi:hypothetical protein
MKGVKAMLMKVNQMTSEMFAITNAALELPAISVRLHPISGYTIGGIGTNERFSRTLESSKGKKLEPKTENGYTRAEILAKVKRRFPA